MRSLARWTLARRTIVGAAAVLAVTAGVLVSVARSGNGAATAPPDSCVVGDWSATSFRVLTDLGAAWVTDTPTAGRLRLGADGRGSYSTGGGWVEFTSTSEYGNVDRHRVNETTTFRYRTDGGTISFSDLTVEGREGRPGLETAIPPGYVFMSLSSLISDYGGTSATRYVCGVKNLTLTHANDTMLLAR